MTRTKTKTTTVAALAVALGMSATAAASASDGDVVVITGNTVDTAVEHESELAPDGTGWWFERDPGNRTGHEFTADGVVTNVGPDAGEKFIAENFLFQRVSEVGEISFEYVSDAPDSEFYINVYVNHESEASGEWYDCRYDYTAVTTSNDGVKSVTTSGVAQTVASRNGTVCPASLADSPDESFVRAYAINVGDTSASALAPATILSSTAAGITYVFQARTPIATGELTITNNGSYSRTYSEVAYFCGTDHEVLFSSTEQAGSTGNNDDGQRFSTIDGTINTSTGLMNWNYTREEYTASFSGTGIYDGATSTYTFQQDPAAPATGNVLDAAGTFTNVPTCASVPDAPADVCKKGGWESNADGPFKNQGQCVSFYAKNK